MPITTEDLVARLSGFVEELRQLDSSEQLARIDALDVSDVPLAGYGHLARVWLGLELPLAYTAGDVLGQHRVTRQVSSAGWTQVYEADTRTPQGSETGVVLKCIEYERLIRDEESREAFRAALQELPRRAPSGPRLAEARATGIEVDARGRSIAWIAVRRVQGRTLDRYCDNARLTYRERLDLFAEVCRAVEEAHAGDVAHLDVNPANILVTSHRPTLLNVGMSRLLDRWAPVEVRALCRGTLPFISPEQIDPSVGTPGRATDIYALGAILYQMLIGRPPRERTIKPPWSIERIRDVIGADPPAQQLDIWDFQSDVGVVISTAMARDPRARYSDVEVMRDAVEAAVGKGAPEFLKRRPLPATNFLHVGLRRNEEYFGFDQSALTLKLHDQLRRDAVAHVLVMETSRWRYEIARDYAIQFQSSYAHVWWVNASTPDHLTSFARFIGADGDGDAMAHIFARLEDAGRRHLLVLVGLNDSALLDTPKGPGFSSEFRSKTDSRILVAPAQQALKINGAIDIDLGPLSAAHAREVLTRPGGDVSGEVLDAVARRFGRRHSALLLVRQCLAEVGDNVQDRYAEVLEAGLGRIRAQRQVRYIAALGFATVVCIVLGVAWLTARRHERDLAQTHSERVRDLAQKKDEAVVALDTSRRDFADRVQRLEERIEKERRDEGAELADLAQSHELELVNARDNCTKRLAEEEAKRMKLHRDRQWQDALADAQRVVDGLVRATGDASGNPRSASVARLQLTYQFRQVPRLVSISPPIKGLDQVALRPAPVGRQHPGAGGNAGEVPRGMGFMAISKTAVEAWTLDSRIAPAFGLPAAHVAIEGRTALPRLNMLALSPDSTAILSSHRDGVLRVWDVATGSIIALNPLGGEPAHVSFSADGTHALTTATDETAIVWNVAPGGQWSVSARLTTPEGPAVLWGALDRSGRRAVTGDEIGNVVLWELSSEVPREVFRKDEYEGGVRQMAMAASGEEFVSIGYDGKALLWNAAGLAPTELGDLVPTKLSEGAIAKAQQVAFDPSDEVILLVTEQPPGLAIELLEATSGRPYVTVPHDGSETSCIRFSQDGSRLLVAGTTSVIVWSWGGKGDSVPRAWLLPHREAVLDARFSQDGDHLVTACRDGSVRIWEMPRLPWTELDAAGGTDTASVHPDGGAIVGLAAGEGRRWVSQERKKWESWHPDEDNADHFRVFRYVGENVLTVGVASDVVRLLSDSLEELARLDGPVIDCADASPDGRWLAIATREAVELVAVDRNQARFEVKKLNSDLVEHVAFSADSRNLALALDSGSIRIFSVEDRSFVEEFRVAELQSIKELAYGTPKAPGLMVAQVGNEAILTRLPREETNEIDGPILSRPHLRRVVLDETGDLALIAADEDLVVWHLESDTEVLKVSLGYRIDTVAVDPRWRTLFVSGKNSGGVVDLTTPVATTLVGQWGATWLGMERQGRRIVVLNAARLEQLRTAERAKSLSD